MKNRKGLLSFVILLWALRCPAYVPEEGNVSGAIGPYIEKTDFKGSSTNAHSPYLGGLAIMVLGDVNNYGSLEVDLFFMNKTYLREQVRSAYIEQTQVVQVNMGYRWWLTPEVSMGAALYSAYSMGEPYVVQNDFAPGREPDTSARDITEYGFDFSTQLEIWRLQSDSVILDGRYALSVTSKPNEESNHFGIVIAWRHLLQDKPNKDETKGKKQ